MARSNQPIPCSTFNSNGSLYAYAVSYDWSKGAENHNPATAKHYILLHGPPESEIKGKQWLHPYGQCDCKQRSNLVGNEGEGTTGRKKKSVPSRRLRPAKSDYTEAKRFMLLSRGFFPLLSLMTLLFADWT